MNDITALMATMKAAAEKAKHAGEAPVMDFYTRIDALNEFQLAACPANVLALVEAMESRTVTVKLAEDRTAESEISGYDGTEFYRSGWNARGKADRDALAAAGIQVIEGEGQ